ncbi:hypothetical protein Pla8534_00310 [Lignipirellula cremea]|uniref:DUF1552 domain-containing protein n=2 Tax=Lignipirellula cremea TaxID=2528010 RepID=A0A518DKB9_9BACT|nr:hypothetical protein Pla8534_00310 [Lignipirellula cremea]
MKKSWKLNRRTFLRGTGVTLGLPLLDCMSKGWASAAEEKKLPRRLACMFFPNGVSLPREDDPHYEDWHWFPHGEGRDFRFTKILESLEPLRKQLSILGGLSHPGARTKPGHTVSDVFLTGAKIGASEFSNSISIDQMFAQHVGRHTRLHSLQLSTTGGVGVTGRPHTLSYTKDGQAIHAEDNLRRAFTQMFGSSAESDAAVRETVSRRKSMLDLVLDSSRSLNSRLGKQDQAKLEEYLSSVRETERRVERTEQWLDIPKAKVDPASLMLDANRERPLDYIRAMYDLMLLAFQTDTTRVATYMIGTEGGNNITDFFPNALGLDTHHRLSHNRANSTDGFKLWGMWDQFLTQQFAYFLQKLKDTPEGEGNLLDRTLVFYGCSTSNTHNARNYPLILAGGGDFGLKHGHYRKFDENKCRLSDLFVTMLNTLGVETRRFADSTSEISEVTTS